MKIRVMKKDNPPLVWTNVTEGQTERLAGTFKDGDRIEIDISQLVWGEEYDG